MAEPALLPVDTNIPDKLYLRIGDVSKLTGVKPYVLRFWENEFPGLGPKKTKVIHDELGVETVEQLEKACQEGKVAKLKGFGEKTQTNILAGIERRRSYAAKHLVSDALVVAEPLLEAIGAPLERQGETSGD